MKSKDNLRLCRKQSSGMWRRTDIVLTDVSEERIASIFRVEEKEEILKRTSVSRCLSLLWCQYLRLCNIE
jgi:hypothetical protein